MYGPISKIFKDFSERFNRSLYRTLGTATDFCDCFIGKIIQGIEQKTLPLFLSAESRHRKNFFTGFHAADILLRCFTIGQTALSGNYVLVIAAFVRPNARAVCRWADCFYIDLLREILTSEIYLAQQPLFSCAFAAKTARAAPEKAKTNLDSKSQPGTRNTGSNISMFKGN